MRYETKGEAVSGGGSIIRKFGALEEEAPFPVERLVVRYEEFVTDYPAWAERVAAFLALVLEVGEVVRATETKNETASTGEHLYYASALDYAREVGLDQRKGSHIRNVPRPAITCVSLTRRRSRRRAAGSRGCPRSRHIIIPRPEWAAPKQKHLGARSHRERR